MHQWQDMYALATMCPSLTLLLLHPPPPLSSVFFRNLGSDLHCYSYCLHKSLSTAICRFYCSIIFSLFYLHSIKHRSLVLCIFVLLCHHLCSGENQHTNKQPQLQFPVYSPYPPLHTYVFISSLQKTRAASLGGRRAAIHPCASDPPS